MLKLVVSCVVLQLMLVDARNFDLDIFHTNDFHTFYDGFKPGKFESICQIGGDNKCFGGAPRLLYWVNHGRRSCQNSLLLDGGDQMQGTGYFSFFKWAPVAAVVNKFRYSAMALGNHEFDDGIPSLIQYLKNVTSPFVCANMDASAYPELQKLVKKSIIKKFKHAQVGIIGYIISTVPKLAATGDLKFTDEVTAIKKEAEFLEKQGVKIIIALGHAGFDIDKKIAANVPQVSVVVGGHTDTLLYNGDVSPTNDEIAGPYPAVVKKPGTNKIALVVQAGSKGKYLGHLQLRFNRHGRLRIYKGDNYYIQPNTRYSQEMKDILLPFQKSLKKQSSKVVGSTTKFLSHAKAECRLKQCGLGSVVADAFLEFFQDLDKSGNKNNVYLSFMNAGSLRASLEVGDITNGEMKDVLPFGSDIEMVPISGDILYDVFEKSVSEIVPEDPSGRFLQVSGFEVTYDLSAPVNSRVISLKATNKDKLEIVDRNKEYNVVAPNFILNGNDGYDMLKKIPRIYTFAFLDSDIFRTYLQKHNPITQVTEARIILQ